MNKTNLIRRLRAKSLRERRNRRKAIFCEPLEERLLLATVRWAVDSDGAWADAANWIDEETGLNRLPTAADDVVLDRAAGNFTVTIDAAGAVAASISSRENLVIGGSGDLSVGNDFTPIGGNYTVSGGLNVGGTLNIPIGTSFSFQSATNLPAVNLSGGSIGGDAQLTANRFDWSGGTMGGTGGLLIPSGGSLDLTGVNARTLDATLNNAGTIRWTGAGQLNGGGKIVNQAGGIMDVRTNSTLGAAIENAGTWNITTSSATFFVRGELTNTGDFNVNDGQVVLIASSQNSGVFEVADGGELVFSSNLFPASVHTIEAGAALRGSGIYLQNHASGTVVFNADASVENYVLANGAISGPADLTVTNRFDWSGGAMRDDGDGNGTTVVAAGATLDIAGDLVKTLDGRRLTNQGTVNWSDAGSINGTNDGTFINAAQLNVLGDSRLNAHFVNTGTVHKSASTGGATVFVSYDNQGTIDVDSGTVTLITGTNSGVLDVAPRAALEFSSTITQIQHTLGPGTRLDGEGQYSVLGFGQLDIQTDVAVNRLDLLGGFSEIRGPGMLTVLDSMTWTAGNMRDDGITRIEPGASLLINGNVGRTLNRKIENAGTATWTEGNLLGEGEFENQVGGIFQAQSDGVFSAPFDNQGIFNSESPSGTGNHNFRSAAFDNSGTVNSLAGSLLISNGTSTGVFHAAAGARVNFSHPGGGTSLHHLEAGTRLTGVGTHAATGIGMNLSVNAPVTATNFEVALSNPLFSGIIGGSTLTVTGQFDWLSGTIHDNPTIVLAATGNMDITGIATLLRATLRNFGTVNLAETAQFTNRGDIINAGEFNIDTDRDVGGDAFALFDNLGTLNKRSPDGTAVTELTSMEFQNSGILNVLSGGLDIDVPLDLTGTTLAGGAWNIADHASLILPAGATIETNAAAVSLAGPNSVFAAIDSLSNNEGNFAILDGRDFSSTGDLQNAGSLTVGVGSTLAVLGTYTQSGSLEVQFAGDPASGQFGRLNSRDAASLDGNLVLRFVDFDPTPGDEFTVMTFPSRAGNFTQVDRIADGTGRFVSVDVTPVSVIVQGSLAPPDLEVTSITIPATATPGEDITIDYTVTNLSTLATAANSLVDSIYLSANETFDSSDRLIGRVTHAGSVPGGGSYDETLTVPLPAALPGNYRVIVISDSRAFTADFDRSNNAVASFTPLLVDMAELVPGVPFAGNIEQGQDVFFRVDLSPGQTANISADFATVAGAAELYVRHQDVPDSQSFDQFAFQLTETQQEILLTGTQGGTYFLWLHGRENTAGGVPFEMLVQPLGFEIFDFTPQQGSNAGQATLTITGSQFTSDTVVTLMGAGDVERPAANVLIQDSSTLFATFDLTGLTTGDYSLSIENTTESDTSATPFTVTDTAAGQVQLRFQAPDGVRQFREGIVTVDYWNPTEIDLPAPIVVMVAENGALKLTEQNDFVGEQLAFLAINEEGPAGTLPPGYQGSLTIDFTTSGRSGEEVDFSAFIADPDIAVDWNAPKDALRPEDIPPDAWDFVFANLVSSIGGTARSFQTALGENATYLSQLGQYMFDVDRLLNLEIDEANAEVLRIPQVQVDLEFPTPGLDLEFGRAYDMSIGNRFELGRLGRGWSDSWDIFLEQDSEGNARIGWAGATRRFARQSDGTFAGQRGDTSELTDTGSGFRLREIDGRVVMFHADGRWDFIEDANGNRLTAIYTGGNLTQVQHSSGSALSFAYNTAGRIERVTDAAGREVVYTYDASGEYLLGASTPAGDIGYTYFTGLGDAREHALASITIAGAEDRFEYDAQGRLMRQFFSGGAETITYGYEANGEVVMTDANGAQTRIFYSDVGDVGRLDDPALGTIQATFDPGRNLAAFTSPGGITATMEFDTRGNMTSVTDAEGATSTFEFDPAFDVVTSFTDPRGNTNNYVYDSEGNLTELHYPDGSFERFEYDGFGNVIRWTSQAGKAVEYAYNNLGLLARIDLEDGSSLQYGYDSAGRLTSASNALGATTFTYDDENRLTLINYPHGRFLDFDHDALGRRIRAEDQDGFVVQYAYDATGRLESLRDGGDSLLVQYTHDDAGQMIRRDLGNDTFTTYEYVQGRPTRILNHAPDGAINSRFEYGYDERGRLVEVASDDGTTAYAYDASGQLTTVDFPDWRRIQYAYDAAGNRTVVQDNGTTATYTANDLNQYTQAGSASYTFDANGNIETATDASGTTTYTYNDLNQLMEVNGPGGITTYEYDALGNRVAEITGGQRTEFVVDPVGFGNVVSQYVDGALEANYVHGLGLVGRVAAGGNAGFYDFDLTGSTRGISDASGSYVNEYRYTPFGEVTALAETVPNPFTFVGLNGIREDPSGLIHMRGRDYDPVLGHFTSNNPLHLEGDDTNLLRYAFNNPVEIVDPSGLPGFHQNPRGQVPNTPSSQPWNTGGGDRLGQPAPGEDALGRGRGQGPRGGPRGGGPRPPGGGRGFRFPRFPGGFNPGAALRTPAGMGAAGLGALAGYGAFRSGMFRDNLTWAVSKATPPWFTDMMTDFFKNNPAYWHAAVAILGSEDPNDIIGPGGFGPEKFITDEVVTLPYQIRFENIATATAPAQEVFITQQLDTDLDFNSFELGSFGFGGQTFDVPSGRTSYTARIDQRAVNGEFVDVRFEFDTATGLAIWTFTSIDPATGDLPSDPLGGFLPPNVTPPEGDGFVTYTIRPKPGLTTGTRLDAEASIIFDTNDPIVTPAIFNTIDADAPRSEVEPLPAETNEETFTVRWSGEDGAGSGIAFYDIFFSQNGGQFQPFLLATAETSAPFTGQFGSRYRFFSVATDNLGFREDNPPFADAETVLLEDRGFLPGDIDQNGNVGLSDFVILKDHFGIGTLPSQGDIDEDGDVDLADFTLLKANFGLSLENLARAGEIRALSEERDLEAIDRYFTD